MTSLPSSSASMASGRNDPHTPEEENYLKFGCLRTFQCGSSSINSVRFFGDADHILAGASNKSVYLLSAQHGILHEFAGEHTDVVSCVGSDNAILDLFVSGGLDRRSILWDVPTGEAVRQFPRTSPVNACLLRPSPSPLAHVVAVGDADGRVRLFDIRSSNRRFGYVQVLSDAKDAISSILATPEKILVASLDGCVYTYDLRKGALHSDCYGCPITCLSRSPDDTVLLISCVDASVRLIEASTGECLHAFWGHRQTTSGAYRLYNDFITSSRRLPPTTTRAAASLFWTDLALCESQETVVTAFDELLETFQRCNQASGGWQAELAAQVPYAVSGSEDCCIYFWDILAAASTETSADGKSNKLVGSPVQQGVHGKAHDAPALVVKADPLTQRLCTAAVDGTVKLWRQL